MNNTNLIISRILVSYTGTEKAEESSLFKFLTLLKKYKTFPLFILVMFKAKIYLLVNYNNRSDKKQEKLCNKSCIILIIYYSLDVFTAGIMSVRTLCVGFLSVDGILSDTSLSKYK